MKATRNTSFLLLATTPLCLLTACGQMHDLTRSPGVGPSPQSRFAPPTTSNSTWSPLEADASRSAFGGSAAGGSSFERPAGAARRAALTFDSDRLDSHRLAPPRRKPYRDTKVRLEFFSEQIELHELDVDFETGPDGTLIDTERDRFGFRASFGSSAIGGFVQVFGEEFRAPALLLADFDNFGVGGGVVGAPAVGKAGDAEFVIPFKFEVDVAAGVEEVGGFDLEFVYFETMLEFGFGARVVGLQPSAGFLVHNFVGLFESDNPASPSNVDPSVITGVNVGGFAELLYKHDKVPVVGRVRAIFGDISGVMFTLGVAF